MKYKVLVSFLVNEDEPDLAEIEIENQLGNIQDQIPDMIEEFEILDVIELDDEE